MIAIVVLDVIAVAGFGAALIGAALAPGKALGAVAKLFLCLSLLTCLFSSVSNVLEHTGITARLDVYEDYGEILFVPFCLCFVYAFWTRNELGRRRRVEESLAHERYLLHALMDNVPSQIYFKDTKSRFTRISRAGAVKFGLTDPSETLGKTDFDFFSDEHAREAFEDEQEVMRTGKPLIAKEERETWPDGTVTWVLTSKLPLVDADGNLMGTFGISRDITERKRAEEELRQAQKMEAVGRLAGGIAHDFNNQLTVVKGYCDLLLMDPQLEESIKESLSEIRSAAERATKLTARLLAFGRKQALHPEVIDLNDVIGRMAEPLGRMIGEDVKLSIEAGPGLGSVLADPDQVEQALMNLAINARDAMPDGGELTIETANVALTDDAAGGDVSPRPYVALKVRDTGIGMSRATRERIFEPFFTTKPVGQGTGLGLAMVYGFVTQSGGRIDVASEPGKGSEFTIHLPRVERAPEAKAPAPEAPDAAGAGTETILIVEDDGSVRHFVARVLRQEGYTVLESSGPDDAIDLGAAREGPIHLLITDVVMPGMRGPELVKRLAGAHVALPVLYISGYTGLEIDGLEDDIDGESFLHKPFDRQQLLRKVREILDRDRPA